MGESRSYADIALWKWAGGHRYGLLELDRADGPCVLTI